jgi:hypothetical protein
MLREEEVKRRMQKTLAIQRELRSIGIKEEPEVLDALVHDCLSEQESTINNEGEAAQIEYLLSNGWTSDDIIGRIKIALEETEE